MTTTNSVSLQFSRSTISLKEPLEQLEEIANTPKNELFQEAAETIKAFLLNQSALQKAEDDLYKYYDVALLHTVSNRASPVQRVQFFADIQDLLKRMWRIQNGKLDRYETAEIDLKTSINLLGENMRKLMLKTFETPRAPDDDKDNSFSALPGFADDE